MTAQDAFTSFVAVEVAPLLRGAGFQKKDFTFHRRLETVVHVIQLQKSAYSSSTEVSFTINVGVFSPRLNELLREHGGWAPDVVGPPKESQCQLRERIGFLAPQKKDTWWPVPASGHAKETAAEVQHLLSRHALPFLETVRSNEALRDGWLALWRAGAPAARGVELALLLLDLEPREELPALLRSLKERASQRTATDLLTLVERIEAASRSR